MSASLKALTVEALLARERTQPLRFEFDGVQPVAMTGGNRQHSRVQTRPIGELYNRVNTPCEPHGPDLKVATHAKVRYPDASVVCGDGEPDTDLVNPATVFEVLSQSTALTDRRVKPFDYASVPSILVCVVLDSEQPEFIVMRRATGWEAEVFAGTGQTVSLPEIGVALPLGPIYRS